MAHPPTPRPNLDNPWPMAARAGAIAALFMLLVQLALRLFASSTGVQAFPEFIVAAVARLTPLDFFAFMTETFGSLAQNALFVIVLLGVVAVGYEGGAIAERLYDSGRLGSGLVGRMLAGLLVATVLFLFTNLAILPVAYLGVFASGSRNGPEIVIQLAITFALYAVTWAVLSYWLSLAEAPAVVGSKGRDVPRRTFLGVATLGLVGGVGALAVRVMQPRGVTDEAASQQVAREIASRASASTPTATEAGGVAPPATPPAEPAPGTPVVDMAQVFNDLEAAGELTQPVTSVADFYHVSKNLLDPTVDAEDWRLVIDGLVDTPLEFTYDDIVARADTVKLTTLCCISNEIGGNLIGTAEWTGVPLVELLDEAGVQPEAYDLKLSCADDYEDSITVETGRDPNVLVVVGMNGEPLTPDHGYPARLIVPPIYGMKNVKWVQRIEAVAEDFLGYWQTRGWDDAAPYQIWGRIDSPKRRDVLKAGPALAAGVASAGDRGISRVELSLDDGDTWHDAILEPSLNPPFTWVRWVFPFEATEPAVTLTMRATDGEGNVAPKQQNPPLPAGATGWPWRSVKVEA